MAKLNGATWDKMGRDARKELLKKTGSFPGNVGKDWDELTDGAKARLTGATVAEANTKTDAKPAKKSPTVAKATADIEHAKELITKKTAKKAPESVIDDEIVKDARKKLTKDDHNGLLVGRWPKTAKNFPGLCFVAIPSSGEVVKCDCATEKEALDYVNAILKK